MVKYAILVDINRCYGCHSCEVACKQENNLPIGIKWIRVVTVGPREIDGKLRMDFFPTFCKHCGKPKCMDVCPEKAIIKRPDGIVLVKEELCIGCQQCIDVCPARAIQYNEEKGTVEKCNLCHDRIDKGLKPACVISCPAGALYFGHINRVIEELNEKSAYIGSN